MECSRKNLMEDFEILNLSDSTKWKHYMEQLPVEQQDIYYTPGYYRLYEDLDDGKACCFVFKKGGDIALYPFLINSVNELGYDLIENILIYKERMAITPYICSVRMIKGEYGMQTSIKPQTFCCRNFSTEDLLMIQEVVTTCGGISRHELEVCPLVPV